MGNNVFIEKVFKMAPKMAAFELMKHYLQLETNLLIILAETYILLLFWSSVTYCFYLNRMKILLVIMLFFF